MSQSVDSSLSEVTLVVFINIFMQILSLMELNYLTFERGQCASEVRKQCKLLNIFAHV